MEIDCLAIRYPQVPTEGTHKAIERVCEGRKGHAAIEYAVSRSVGAACLYDPSAMMLTMPQVRQLLVDARVSCFHVRKRPVASTLTTTFRLDEQLSAIQLAKDVVGTLEARDVGKITPCPACVWLYVCHVCDLLNLRVGNKDTKLTVGEQTLSTAQLLALTEVCGVGVYQATDRHGRAAWQASNNVKRGGILTTAESVIAAEDELIDKLRREHPCDNGVARGSMAPVPPDENMLALMQVEHDLLASDELHKRLSQSLLYGMGAGSVSEFRGVMLCHVLANKYIKKLSASARSKLAKRDFFQRNQIVVAKEFLDDVRQRQHTTNSSLVENFMGYKGYSLTSDEAAVLMEPVVSKFAEEMAWMQAQHPSFAQQVSNYQGRPTVIMPSDDAGTERQEYAPFVEGTELVLLPPTNAPVVLDEDSLRQELQYDGFNLSRFDVAASAYAWYFDFHCCDDYEMRCGGRTCIKEVVNLDTVLVYLSWQKSLYDPSPLYCRGLLYTPTPHLFSNLAGRMAHNGNSLLVPTPAYGSNVKFRYSFGIIPEEPGDFMTRNNYDLADGIARWRARERKLPMWDLTGARQVSPESLKYAADYHTYMAERHVWQQQWQARAQATQAYTDADMDNGVALSVEAVRTWANFYWHNLTDRQRRNYDSPSEIQLAYDCLRWQQETKCDLPQVLGCKIEQSQALALVRQGVRNIKRREGC